VTERGYVSYQFGDSMVRSYVHGNFDAISFSRENSKLECISSTSFFSRDYNLQYSIEFGSEYTFYLTNNSKKSIVANFILYDSLVSSKVIHNEKVFIESKGVKFYRVSMPKSDIGRLVIRSKLIMARPLVFKRTKNKLDCFHG